MPLYNAERYLDATLESLLGQTFTDFELVVCDNASTDRTWEICMKYAKDDARVRLIGSDVNLGAAYNYNRAVEQARGPLFKWVAYDDICAPTLLERCVAALDVAGPAAVLAYPQTTLIDDDGAEIGPHRDGLDLRSVRPYRRTAQFARNWSLCNAVFGVIRTDVLRNTGMIRPYPSSDVVLLAELASLGQFWEVQERLFYRRIHAASSRQGKADMRAVAQWFDTQRKAEARPPKSQLIRRVSSVMANGDLPAADKLSCIAAFATVWSYRKAHIRGSHLKRALLRTVPAAWRGSRQSAASGLKETR